MGVCKLVTTLKSELDNPGNVGTDFALDLLNTNHRGELKVDAKGHTGSKGIFAACDVTDDQSKQIVIAAGSGASAALGAFEYLVSQV